MFISQKSVIRAEADNEDYELQQMRDMAAARKRWEALVFHITAFNSIVLFDVG